MTELFNHRNKNPNLTIEILQLILKYYPVTNTSIFSHPGLSYNLLEHPDELKILLNAMIDIHKKNQHGETIFALAIVKTTTCYHHSDQVSRGRKKFYAKDVQTSIELLLKKGANPNTIIYCGGIQISALMQAARVGSYPVILSLLKHRANPNTVDLHRRRASDYAKMHHHKQLHGLLKSAELLSIKESAANTDTAAKEKPSCLQIG